MNEVPRNREDALDDIPVATEDRVGDSPHSDLRIAFSRSVETLALSALDEDDKAAIRRKGYDLNRIMSELSKSKESILRHQGLAGIASGFSPLAALMLTPRTPSAWP